MFSQRTAWNRTTNRLAAHLEKRRQAGDRLLDLTVSNPTRAGLTRGVSLDALREAVSGDYEPDPRGDFEARRAVSTYYKSKGTSIDPEQIRLTASTSDAYGYLFKLLADGGDEVLLPQPSYPLLSYLAGLEGLTAIPYRLDYESSWTLDTTALIDRLSDRTRALLTVHPNNPTGNLLREAERAHLDAALGPRGIALIADEVFADFLHGEAPPVAAVAGLAGETLTFTLSGLSKVCGLPHLKLSWIVFGGPDALVTEALERFDIISDTYLALATPIQHALPRLLDERGRFQDECLGRICLNRETLAKRLTDSPVEMLQSDGGWCACLRVPRTASEEDLTLALLNEDDIVVHPGYFFEFPEEAYLVVSLITPADELTEGIDRIVRRFL